MKKLLLFLLLIMSASNIQAQDVIVKKDGSTVVCRVVEVNSLEIVYKKWTDLNGSNYVMNRADASAINYQSGKKENLGEMTNLYAPNNQNSGTQMVNDKALLAIDADTRNLTKKVKTLKTIGWIGGGVICATGVALTLMSLYDAEIVTGVGVTIGGVAWTSGFLIAAHTIQKQANRLQMASIYQQEFKLKNGSSFTTGVDVLKDQILNTQTIGIGLSYNF